VEESALTIGKEFFWQCLHVGNPTAKIEYFPSGSRLMGP